MTAQLKRFPNKPDCTPEEHSLWVKYDRLANRIQEVARKADLLSYAVGGLMALEDKDDAWPLRDAADDIHSQLTTIAEEIRSRP